MTLSIEELEILIRIWATLVAMMQALGIIGVYLITIHLLITLVEYFGRRRAISHAETPDQEAEDEGVEETV